MSDASAKTVNEATDFMKPEPNPNEQETDPEVVATCALPISITALFAMEKGLSAQYGPGLYMRQRGTMLEFFKPSSAIKRAKPSNL